MPFPRSIEAQVAPLTLAALRVTAGALFLGHGLVKVIGFPAGAQPGVQPLLSLFGSAGVVEIVTGLLLIIGLLTRLAAFVASGEMAIGYWLVHAPLSFYPAVNGGDAAILFSFIFLHIAAVAPGAFSIDGLLSRRVDARIGFTVPIVSNAP